MSDSFLKDAFDTDELPLEKIPAVIIKLAEMQSSLSARLLREPDAEKPSRRSDAGYAGRAKAERNQEDRLLSAKEAAERLSVSTDYLYRNKNLPFRVKLPNSSKALFSSNGIDRYLKSQRRG